MMAGKPLSTTLALLHDAGACPTGYKKLVQYLGGAQHYGAETHIPLTVVLDSNGLDDALWCLKAVPPEQEAHRDKLSRLLACDYAEHVLPIFEAVYPDDMRPTECIATARRFAWGEATDEELAEAGYAARSAAGYAGAAGSAAGAAARSAAGAAAGYAGAAGYAAVYAAKYAAVSAAVSAAGDAAGDAAGSNREAELQWQTDRFRDYLNHET